MFVPPITRDRSAHPAGFAYRLATPGLARSATSSGRFPIRIARARRVSMIDPDQ